MPWAWLEIASCNWLGLADYIGSGDTVDFDIVVAAAAAVVGRGHFAAAAVGFGVDMLVAGRSSGLFEEPVADCKIGWTLGIVIAVLGPSGAILIQPSRCVSW